MKMPVFSIRDIHVGFGSPSLDANEYVAKRGFSYSINKSDIPSFRPSDFELYKIGVFDTDTGKIESILPELICTGMDVYQEK